MKIEAGKYYHLYNRSNNNEVVFKEEQNYDYFLKKYHTYCDPFFEMASYCLMPTHFHFLVIARSDDVLSVRKSTALWLSSYTKAINKRFERHGSLFQSHTKAKEITDGSHLVVLISYIHQNPIRARLVKRLEDWPYSTYRRLIGMSKEEWMQNRLFSSLFDAPRDFQTFSEASIESVNKEFWV